MVDVRCNEISCIYNTSKRCTLEEIEIDEDGNCDSKEQV